MAHAPAHATGPLPPSAKVGHEPGAESRGSTSTKQYSPEQIAGRLREDHPDNPEMWVSTETIYQSLYVQSRGELRRDLAHVCAPAERYANPTARAPSARTVSSPT